MRSGRILGSPVTSLGHNPSACPDRKLHKAYMWLNRALVTGGKVAGEAFQAYSARVKPGEEFSARRDPEFSIDGRDVLLGLTDRARCLSKRLARGSSGQQGKPQARQPCW
jgi:hypothetical protein